MIGTCFSFCILILSLKKYHICTYLAPFCPLAGSASPTASATNPDPKQEWHNLLIASLWPRVTDYVEALIKEKVEDIIKEKLPFSVTFQKLDFGKEPAHFEYMTVKKYQTVTQDGKNDNLFLSMYIKYIGDSNINIALPAGVCVGVSEIKVVGGPLIIEMSKMLSAPPFFSGIQVYFANTPKVYFSWIGCARAIDASKGEQSTALTAEIDGKDVVGGLLGWLSPSVMLRSWIQDAIENALEGNVVSPNRMEYLMNRKINFFDVNKPLPTGIFELKLLRGNNLPAGDWSLFSGDSSDPYCVVQFGGVKWTSSIADSSLNPEWKDEAKDFFTYQHLEESTMVKISVYDYDFMLGGGSPDFLGGLIVPLSELTVKKEPSWHNLVVARSLGGPMGPKGQPSHLLLSGIIHPVTLDRNVVRKIQPNAEKPSYLLFCGIQEVTFWAHKNGGPMTAQVDIAFGEHKETTGAREVPKPEPADQSDHDLQKATKSFETAYIWPIRDLKGEVSITLKINGHLIGTHKFKVCSLLNFENLTNDSSIQMSQHPVMLTRRFQLRAIERT